MSMTRGPRYGRLEDLLNVDTTGVADGDIIVYSDADGSWIVSAPSAGGSSSLSGLDDVVLSGLSDGELIVYDSGSGDWINRTLAEAGISAVGHTHSVSDITDFPTLATVATTGSYDDLTDVPTTFAPSAHTHPATDVVSGTFADARISESSVTQHETALSITESQITDLGNYYESGDTILAASGSSAAPGLSFASETDTGLYLGGTGNLRIAVNGSDLITLSDNGIFNTAVYNADVTQFQATLSWVSSSSDALFTNTNTSLGGKLTLREGTSNGTSGVSFKAPDSMASNLVLLLPSSDGSSGQVLQTNGSGTLSFDDVAEGALDSGVTDKLNSIKLSYLIEDPENKVYRVELFMPEGGSLHTIYYKTQAGSCTLTVQIDGVTVTGWGSLSATTSESNTAASGSNTFTSGESLTIQASSVSSAEDLQITILGELS